MNKLSTYSALNYQLERQVMNLSGISKFQKVNIIVYAGDLTSSNQTGRFLKKTEI